MIRSDPGFGEYGEQKYLGKIYNCKVDTGTTIVE
mgnify:FL=1